MGKLSTAQRTKGMEVDAVAPFRWPDASSTAEVVLDGGLAFCARKAGLKDAQEVVRQLEQGDTNVWHYCCYGLAKEIGECLGNLDDNIRAVYVLDYDATPEDRCFSEETQGSLIHLIVWATRRTDALDALLRALDRALVQKYADMTGAPELARLLDVQIVDDADVENRTGYGALLSSIHNRPIQVWER